MNMHHKKNQYTIYDLISAFNIQNKMGKTSMGPLFHSTQKLEESVHNLLVFYYFTYENVPQP